MITMDPQQQHQTRVQHNPYNPAPRSPTRPAAAATAPSADAGGGAASSAAAAAVDHSADAPMPPSAAEIAAGGAEPNLLVIPPENYEGLLHKPLIGHVSFVPYPKTQPQFVREEYDPSQQYSRIFIGQLPYSTTSNQLDFLSHVFGGGVTLHFAEIIVKNNKKTGCCHAIVRDDQLKQLVAGMHKRLLIDDEGVWVARNAQELQVMTQYVQELKAEPKKRYVDRPYDGVVVQRAVSERQQAHQGLPTVEEYFARQQMEFAQQQGMFSDPATWGQ